MMAVASESEKDRVVTAQRCQKQMKNLSSSPERIIGSTFTGTIFQGV
jgi:hypothetical protein